MNLGKEKTTYYPYLFFRVGLSGLTYLGLILLNLTMRSVQVGIGIFCLCIALEAKWTNKINFFLSKYMNNNI